MSCDECDQQALCDAYQRGQREMRARAAKAAIERIAPRFPEVKHGPPAKRWDAAGDAEVAIQALDIVCICHLK